MKLPCALALAALPLLLAGCATRAPLVFHSADQSALIVQSFDARTACLVTPTLTPKIENTQILDRAKTLVAHQTAVIILEDYPELHPGALFRDRSMGWFIGLRGLGYQRIVFLHGNGSASPDGLPIVAEYE